MNEPQITVIKSTRGIKLPQFDFKLPKVKPVVIILATVLLAIISVVTALYLYGRRSQPVAPTAPASKPEAATTTTISDNFDGASLDTNKWTTTGDATSATATLSGGKLLITIPQQTAQKSFSVRSTRNATGDFSAEVDISDLVTGDSGSAEFLFFGNDIIRARVSRYKTPLTDRIETGFDIGTPTSIDLSSGTGSVKAKIVRLGSTIQTFYDSGSGYTLLASNPSGYSETGHFRLHSTVFSPQFPATTATFDNFTANVNLAGAVLPSPGTPAACTTSFTVLALSSTPTPYPTPTPTGGPTPTPTPTTSPGPTPTPTPTPGAPNNCNGTCGSNANCQGDLFCFDTGVQKYCRNPQNPTSITCAGLPGSTPTPTPTGNAGPTPTPKTITSGPTPTPVTLEEAGSISGTWVVSLTGGALLLLGSILMFAL